jgi:hypothetical protein
VIVVCGIVAYFQVWSLYSAHGCPLPSLYIRASSVPYFHTSPAPMLRPDPPEH